MSSLFERHPANPIVTPGKYDWRAAVAFNPAAVEHDGRVYLYERTAEVLRPFICYIGGLVSDDGVHFEHLSDQPVFTPAMAGSKYGSVQDPRVVKLDGRAYMSFAYRPYAWHCSPTGRGVPESWQGEYEGFDGDDRKNQTRSGLAVSNDMVNWSLHGWVSPETMDDRNVILFPRKIGGRYAVLRRPQAFVATDTGHAEAPSICLSWSEDLRSWTDPTPLVRPALGWEDNRIGGSTPPIETEAGWLVFYHGVQDVDPRTRYVCYRMGALMLDRDDPMRIIARCAEPVFEPTAYYEKVGLVIPNVVFPTGAVVVGGRIMLYYGCCDTAIGLATCRLDDMVAHVMRHKL